MSLADHLIACLDGAVKRYGRLLALDGAELQLQRGQLRALGGTLGIDSPRGQGTRLKVVVPVPILRLVETARAAPALPYTSAQTPSASGQPAA